MLIVSMLRMLGGGTAAVCANAAGQPASAKDNPATEQNHFFMSAHLPGARRRIVEEERIETWEHRSHPGIPRSQGASVAEPAPRTGKRPRTRESPDEESTPRGITVSLIPKNDDRVTAAVVSVVSPVVVG